VAIEKFDFQLLSYPQILDDKYLCRSGIPSIIDNENCACHDLERQLRFIDKFRLALKPSIIGV
jgi:hypothetical protein